LNANIAALTQSQQNAANGIGLLQTADGALSQVTTLLNRAVTLATEGSTTGLTTGAAGSGTQSDALNTEFKSIMNEIDQIGQATNFNGANVFGTASTSATTNTLTGSVTTAGAMDVGKTITITDGTKTLTVTGIASTDTVVHASGTGNTQTASVSSATDLNAEIQTAFGGKLTGDASGGPEVITSTSDTFTVTSTDTGLLGVTSGLKATTPSTTTPGSANTNTVYIGDGTTPKGQNTQIQTSIKGLSAADLGLSSDNLLGTDAAQTALANITKAINTVSAQRGVIGASVNRLTAATGDMSSEVTNLQSAANGLSNADIGKTVANMTQYNVLQSTGMAALQQSNQAQQAVLKLVQ
jgi:flagellin